MNEKLLSELRRKTLELGTTGNEELAKLLKEAVLTIDEQAEKIHVLNMERTAAHYNNGWVPCQDRLPEEYGVYIVAVCTGERKNITTTDFYSTGTWFTTSIKYKNSKVVAWMPLPEPWKGEQE